MVRKFRALGWSGPRYGTKHPFMEKKGDKGIHRQRIPNDHGDDIGVPLLRQILRQAGITDAEWDNA